MKYCLAIDIGASSGRHILFSIDNGKMVLEEIYRFPNAPDKKDGHLVWDTKRLFGHILEGLKKAKELNKIPYSVGIDTWGVDYALLDENGDLIGDVYCYRDSRNEVSSKKVHEIIPFEEIYDRTGIEFAVFNTIYQLFDDKLSGKIKNAKKMLELPDYFNYLLTGIARQEYTNATTTALVNKNTHTWDFELIDKLGLPRCIFGELSQPGNVVGNFSDEVAKIVGYNAKIIQPATHDTASAVLAVPDSGKHQPYISSGTWSLMGVEVPNAITDASFEGKSFSNEGSIDFNFRFQTNIMGMWLFQNVKKEIGGDLSFDELNALAEKSTFTGVFDANDKSFFAPESMTDAIKNYFVKRNQPAPEQVGDICRSVFLSLAECYAKTIKGISAITGKKYDCLHIIGGGSRNHVLNGLTAKSTGLKLITGPTEATAIGNALMQLVALGEISSPAKGKDIIKDSFDIKEI